MTLDLDALDAAARAAAATKEDWYDADWMAHNLANRDDGNYIAALHPGAALALIARVRRAEAALRGALIWHEAEDKALSKQPHGGDRMWRRLQHQEQRDNLRAALEARSDG